MRKIITVLVLLLVTISTFAQQGINYKALIKDNSGNVVANDLIQVQFSIRTSTNVADNLYVETHTPTTDANGLVLLNIGEGTVTSGAFTTIDWASSDHFLNVQVNTGTGFLDLGTTKFKAVPYAKHAETAGNVFSGDYNDLTNQPTTLPSGLEQITENDGSQDNTGWRLIGVDPNNYGSIGENAVDLSYSSLNSSLRGATGKNSIAMGRVTEASGFSSTAIGFSTTASGNNSTAMGRSTTASGVNSTTMGYVTRAPSYAETVIGCYNTEYTPNNVSEWDANDRVFVIGNGFFSDDINRSDALTVFKNGTITAPSFDIAEITDDKALITKEYADSNYLIADGNVVSNNVGIGRIGPSSLFEIAHENSPPTSSDYTNAFSIHNKTTGGSWQFSTVNAGHLSIYKNGSYRGFFNESSGTYSSISDRRVKKDIISIEDGTLAKVMQLNPVSYLMKDQKDSKRNVGLISQEVKEIFPSMTHYVKESDLLTLSYSELIPILIKALQEQQTNIEAQNKTLEELIQRIEVLENKNN